MPTTQIGARQILPGIIPSGSGADAWTYVKLTTDFTTSSATAVDITGFNFIPATSSVYIIESFLLLRTATATVNPRMGIAFPTNSADGAFTIQTPQTATTALTTNGNIGASALVAVGGLPNNTQSWLGTAWGTLVTGATTTGLFRFQLASETAGTIVTAKIGSWFRYRTV